MRQARLARQVSRTRSRRKNNDIGVGTGAGTRRSLLGKAGWVAAILSIGNYAGRVERMSETGFSRRLTDAMDAHTIWGARDEEITGTARARERIESDDTLLRIIGVQGEVNSQIGQLADWFRGRENAIATGADLIEREIEFDSSDTMTDKFIKSARAGIIMAAKEAAAVVREYRGGSATTTR